MSDTSQTKPSNLNETAAHRPPAKPPVNQVTQLKTELQAAREREMRALADYQNLVRRTRDERAQLIVWAAAEFVEHILDPLENLSRAAAQLKDQGLQLVVDQLWAVLRQQGLEELNPIGAEFDPQTMEAVEGSAVAGKVTTVVRPGYRLHQQVLRVAKVSLA